MSTTFEQTTLDNGLTVIAETRDHAHTAAVGFFVKAGARDEHPRQMGVSHFLEHMMFKGSDRRTADDVNREFDEMGADYNAYTSDEMTVYYARVLPEHLSHAVDLLGDMLRPALREADFEMEKKVILEEIGMYEDRPMWRLHDALMETHFGRHPLGHRVLGTSETVSALSAEQMRDYFQQRYGPDQITVAAAGAVDFDRLVADVEKAAGHWTPSGAQRDYLDPAPDAGELTLTDKAIEQHYFAVMTPGPSARDPQRYAARILADVLGDS
ncbi:MAG: pitrilysin family protein, partial [Phycisphaeraceae bacterium]|nr:pitrilysin family protein [Phycisphaeraceae bacterium]